MLLANNISFGSASIAIAGSLFFGSLWAIRSLRADVRTSDASEGSKGLAGHLGYLRMAQRYVFPGAVPLALGGVGLLIHWNAERTPIVGTCWLLGLTVSFLAVFVFLSRAIANADAHNVDGREERLAMLSTAQVHLLRDGYKAAQEAVRKKMRELRKEERFKEKIEALKSKNSAGKKEKARLEIELKAGVGKMTELVRRNDAERDRFLLLSGCIDKLIGIIHTQSESSFYDWKSDEKRAEFLQRMLRPLLNVTAEALGGVQQISASLYIDDGTAVVQPFQYSCPRPNEASGSAWVLNVPLNRDHSILHACRVRRTLVCWPRDRAQLRQLDGVKVPAKSTITDQWPRAYALPIPFVESAGEVDHESYAYLVVRFRESADVPVEFVRFAVLTAGIADLLFQVTDPDGFVRITEQAAGSGAKPEADQR